MMYKFCELICGINCFFFAVQEQKHLKGNQKQFFLQKDSNESIFFSKLRNLLIRLFVEQKHLKGLQKRFVLQNDRNENIFFFKSCANFYFAYLWNKRNLLIRSCFWLHAISCSVVFFFSQKANNHVKFLFSWQTSVHSNQQFSKKLVQPTCFVAIICIVFFLKAKDTLIYGVLSNP